jgi:ribonuclease P protein component
MRLLRLQGRKVCDAVLRKGRVWKGKTVIIRWIPSAPRRPGTPREGVFVGTFASAKISKSAVERNRMRRRIREAMRLSLLERDVLPAAQLLLCPHRASLDAPFELLLSEARTFLSALAQCPPLPPRSPGSSISR